MQPIIFHFFLIFVLHVFFSISFCFSTSLKCFHLLISHSVLIVVRVINRLIEREIECRVCIRFEWQCLLVLKFDFVKTCLIVSTPLSGVCLCSSNYVRNSVFRLFCCCWFFTFSWTWLSFSFRFIFQIDHAAAPILGFISRRVTHTYQSQFFPLLSLLFCVHRFSLSFSISFAGILCSWVVMILKSHLFEIKIKSNFSPIIASIV